MAAACGGNPEIVSGGDGSALDDGGPSGGNAGATGSTGGSGGASTGGSGGASTGGSAGNSTGGTGGSTGGSGGATGGSGGTGGFLFDGSTSDVAFVYDATAPAEDACAEVEAEATLELRPVDIIFVIDNSSSMDDEIIEVQDRINNDFATIIGASGIDFRVIMVARYGLVASDIGGSDNPICIRAPLGAGDCADPNNTPLVNNAPRFFHYSADIESRDSLCKLLGGYTRPDELADTAGELGTRPFAWTPLAPNGWSEWVRPEAFKTFVEITDDDVSCNKYGFNFDDGNSIAGGTQVATDFDAALLALDPAQFGTAANRNYNFFSIVAMSENTPPTDPWPFTAPIQTSNCSPGSSGPGTGYQGLSILTEALRWPTCRNGDFNAVFQAIAQGIIDNTQVACEFDIPTPDAGIIDPSKVQVQYTPGGTGTPVLYSPVADQAACATSDGFYFDDPMAPTKIFLCPTTCTTVQADPDAKINVLFGCLGS